MNLLDGADQTPDIRAEIEAKWKDKPIEELLKAKVESDLYIKSLEKQKDELRDDYLKQREELLAKAKFEEYIDQMRSSNNLPVATPPANEVNSPKYDPADVEKMVLAKIQETEQQKIAATNFNKVQAKLVERYGNNYANVLKDQQQALGLSQDEINSLAQRSPEAFFRIMGLNETAKNDFQAPPRSNQRNDNFAPRGDQVRDWNYYQGLKKTNPMLYLDPKISVQMHNDAIALGDRFGMPSD